MIERSGFDSRRYMIQLSGKDYLPVAARIAWFRHDHTEGWIETELVSLDTVTGRNGQPTERALFKATVQTPEGGRAVGYGSETQADFGDHIEKASTKSIGRALGAMGYGTLESGNEYDGEAQAGRVVDAPQQRPPTQMHRGLDTDRPERRGLDTPQRQQNNVATPQRAPQGQPVAISNPTAPASDAQHRFIADLLRQKLNRGVEDFNFEGLTKGEANQWITHLQRGELPPGQVGESDVPEEFRAPMPSEWRDRDEAPADSVPF